MRLSRTLRRAAAITAASMLVATAVQAAPSGVHFQPAPSDDETTYNGVSIVGPSDQELAAARNAIGDITNQIDRATAELDLVEDELAILQQKLTIASEQFSEAEEASLQATEAADVARDDLARVQGELAEARAAEAENRALLTGFARDAYMYGPSQTDSTLIMLDGMSRNGNSDLVKAQQAVDVVARDRSKILEDTEVLVAATAALEEEAAQMEQARAQKEEEAEAARDEAAHRHATVLELVDQTEAKISRQLELLDELGLDRAVAITALSDLEMEAQRAEEAAAAKRQAEEAARQRAEEAARRAQEAEEAAAAERAAAEQAAAERAAREAEAAAAAAAAQQAEEASQAQQAQQAAQAASEQAADDAAREAERAAEAAASQRAADEAARAAEAARRAQEAADEAAAAQAAADRAAAAKAAESKKATETVTVRPSGSMTTVGGITVSSSIADQVAALLNAARADGIYLGGGGYRSPATTAALRIANGCPDVYTSPASSCRVPTAIPGTSMHERGLAIDFTWKGSTICFPRRASSCVGNAAFDWLKANANKYGLYGLSSEAWHWSTNGH